MADVFDKETKRLLRSVNTPDYMSDRYIINPPFVPDCDPKYIIVEDDNTIREMTDEEKAVVDYVAPPPEPTPEELEAQRDAKVVDEIAKTYRLTDEIQTIRKKLTKLFPDDDEIIKWNDVVAAAKAKYPHVKNDG